MAQLAGANVDRYLNLPMLKDRPKSEMLIRWDAKEFDFETIPFNNVLQGKVPPATFKDRLILVGYVAPGSDEALPRSRTICTWLRACEHLEPNFERSSHCAV
ncbi:CHASE2 domain-containing protein [Paenibacillus validus]|uniref:CHASE2 domain-containing protein n=1 Tax=Paenibacillus validus TaxID=44253 RepID=UPI003D29A347